MSPEAKIEPLPDVTRATRTPRSARGSKPRRTAGEGRPPGRLGTIRRGWLTGLADGTGRRDWPTGAGRRDWPTGAGFQASPGPGRLPAASRPLPGRRAQADWCAPGRMNSRRGSALGRCPATDPALPRRHARRRVPRPPEPAAPRTPRKARLRRTQAAANSRQGSAPGRSQAPRTPPGCLATGTRRRGSPLAPDQPLPERRARPPPGFPGRWGRATRLSPLAPSPLTGRPPGAAHGPPPSRADRGQLPGRRDPRRWLRRARTARGQPTRAGFQA